MSWRILWNPKIRKYLKKLPKKTSLRIYDRVDGLSEDPFHYLEHYEGDDFYKLRIGHFRALIEVDFEKHILKIQVLGPRDIIYKRV